MVGASGAISGVLGAYMLLYPRARVHVIIPLGIIFYPFWIRAMWVVGVWFAMQLVSARLRRSDQARHRVLGPCRRLRRGIDPHARS